MAAMESMAAMASSVLDDQRVAQGPIKPWVQDCCKFASIKLWPGSTERIRTMKLSITMFWVDEAVWKRRNENEGNLPGHHRFVIWFHLNHPNRNAMNNSWIKHMLVGHWTVWRIDRIVSIHVDSCQSACYWNWGVEAMGRCLRHFVSICFQCLLLRCYSMFRSEICCSVYKCIIVRLDMNVSSSTTEIH